jgi:hypothetical protein
MQRVCCPATKDCDVKFVSKVKPKRLSILSAVATLAASVLFSASAGAIQIPDPVIGISAKDETVLVINGGISENAARIFRATLNANPQTDTVLLSSGGGHVNVGLEIAEIIHARGLSTWIPADLECASICSVIFLAGQARMVQGRLGVHQVAMNIENNSIVQTTVGDIVTAINKYGVDPRLFERFLQTPADKMYFLRLRDVINWGVNRGTVFAFGENQGLLRGLKPAEEQTVRPGRIQELLNGL